MNLGLKGRSALIFGGSRGIGAAAATALLEEGCRVGVTSKHKASKGDDPELLSLTADLTKAGDAEAAVAAIVEHHGSIDLAVISAGAAQGGSFLDLADDIWTDALSLKFMGMIRAIRALVPPMKAQGFGRIVVIVGNNGRQPNKAMLPGSAANAACLAVVRGLADELAPWGIRLNALNPGPTRTDRWQTLIERIAGNSGRTFDDVEAEMLATQPLGRIAEADEMGRLAAMLLSDAADMLVGTSLTADGGATKVI